MTEWRYHAFRLNGDGTETPVRWDLPLGEVKLTDALSGPGGLDAYIDPLHPAVVDEDGDPVFVPWQTAIYAEASGQIRGGGILEDLVETGPRLSLPCRGFTGYLDDMPYTSSYSKVQIDPLDVYRHMWGHVQGHKGGDLGITVDSTTSPVRIGEEERDVAFEARGEQVEFTAGPYTLQSWKTYDLGREADALVKETPFDYRMVHTWAGDTPKHHIELGYPKLGTRRKDLRFVLGENIIEQPQLDWDGAGYADQVIVLGAGDGRDRIQGRSDRVGDRLRRPKVIEDKSITSKKRADALATDEAKAAVAVQDVRELVVKDSEHARIGSWQVGDDIPITTMGPWSGTVDMWVRVLSQEYSPAEGRVTLQVVRAGKAA